MQKKMVTCTMEIHSFFRILNFSDDDFVEVMRQTKISDMEVVEIVDGDTCYKDSGFRSYGKHPEKYFIYVMKKLKHSRASHDALYGLELKASHALYPHFLSHISLIHIYSILFT